jgi:hypothetical protein
MDTSKRDLFYIIAISAIILLAVITYWLGEKGNEIVSYISFASAIVSIILALLAIFYSIVQNVNSQQNIGEMKTLISEASRLMTEKAGMLADSASSLEEIFQQFIKTSDEASGPPTPLMDETFHFDASHAASFLLLSFYYMVKCYEFKKPMDLMMLADLSMPPVFEKTLNSRQKNLISFLGVGIISCMQCFLEIGSIKKTEGKREVRIEKLPSGFPKNILTIINARINTAKTNDKEKILLEIGVKVIDSYVKAA